MDVKDKNGVGSRTPLAAPFISFTDPKSKAKLAVFLRSKTGYTNTIIKAVPEGRGARDDDDGWHDNTYNGKTLQVFCRGCALYVQRTPATTTTTTTTTAPPVRPAGSVPGAPSGLRAVGGAGGIALSWDDPGDGSITGYQLRERPSFDADWWCWSGFAVSGTGTITRRMTKLPAGATYRIQLRARNAAGPGPAAEVTATTSAAASPGSAPAAPGGLSGTGADESITLSWNNPGDSTISQYQFRERPDNEASWRCWRRIYHSTAATTGHTMPGITNNTRYRVQLRALNAAGPGPAAETSATPTAGTAPPGP